MDDQDQQQIEFPGLPASFSIDELQSALETIRRLLGTTGVSASQQTRIQIVNGLTASTPKNSLTGAVTTLTWVDVPSKNVAYYNIYAKDIGGSNSYLLLAAASKAPARVFIPISAGLNVTLVVQTVLKSGLAASPADCPAVTVAVPAGTATSATAGANGAVPAQVSGYLTTLTPAGVTIKVPYFNN